MKKSTFLGGTVIVLLLFSVISYSRTYIQQQNKSVQPNQSPAPTIAAAAEAATVATATALKASAPVVASQTYTATAYSLRGRTASGRPVARGVIAADPRVLPLGTRVRIEAGEFSGEYLVADTGGAVKGRRVDIWTPTSREAMRFGRRAVKLTVLEFGGRRNKKAVTSQRANSAGTSTTTTEQAKQDK